MYNVHSRSSSRHDRLRRILSTDVWAYLEGVHWYLSVGSGSDELGWQGKSAATYYPLVWHCTIIGLRSVSRSDDIVLQCHYQRGRAHNGNAIGLPIRLESPWRPCCEIQCHCQRTFQPAPCGRRTDSPGGWQYSLHLVISDDAKLKTVWARSQWATDSVCFGSGLHSFLLETKSH